MKHDLYIDGLDVIPAKNGKSNVVSRVRWSFIYEDENGDTSRSAGMTDLNTDDLVNFTPVDALTEAQISAWVKAELDSRGQYLGLVDSHRERARSKRKAAELVPWSQPLQVRKIRPVEKINTVVSV